MCLLYRWELEAGNAPETGKCKDQDLKTHTLAHRHALTQACTYTCMDTHTHMHSNSCSSYDSDASSESQMGGLGHWIQEGSFWHLVMSRTDNISHAWGSKLRCLDTVSGNNTLSLSSSLPRVQTHTWLGLLGILIKVSMCDEIFQNLCIYIYNSYI